MLELSFLFVLSGIQFNDWGMGKILKLFFKSFINRSAFGLLWAHIQHGNYCTFKLAFILVIVTETAWASIRSSGFFLTPKVNAWKPQRHDPVSAVLVPWVGWLVWLLSNHSAIATGYNCGRSHTWRAAAVEPRRVIRYDKTCIHTTFFKWSPGMLKVQCELTSPLVHVFLAVVKCFPTVASISWHRHI